MEGKWAQKIRKTEFSGVSTIVQLAGLVAPVVGGYIGWDTTRAFIGFLIAGALVGLTLFVVGGRMAIKYVCGNCRNVLSSEEAQICPACGVPFTMEGAQGAAAAGTARSNMAVASLMLGIISLSALFMPVPAALAIVFGVIAIIQARRADGTGGMGLAISGIVCGSVSLVIGILILIFRI